MIIWKRKSIWFKLPHWKDLEMHHNFDIMHIEKNVCDNIVNTLLAVNGKTKDNIDSRYDLDALNIRKDLQPIDLDADEVFSLLRLTQWNLISRGHFAKHLKMPCFLMVMHLTYAVMCMLRRKR